MDDYKSGKNIREAILKFFQDNDVQNETLINNCFFVSDNGSNMIYALDNFKRLPCACHMIATVLNHTLQLKSLSKNCAPIDKDDPCMQFVQDIKRTVSAVKSITTYFKQAELNNKLQKSLKQSNETRWNSTLNMLKSFLESKDDVEKILLLKNKVIYWWMLI